MPSDLKEPARQGGFFQRARGLQDAEYWLRLILMHVGGGLSLEQTVLRAGELGPDARECRGAFQAIA